MLKVWLPLDGDLRNLGASDLQFTNENTTNITIDNNGKIGKCYKRNSMKTAGRIIADKTLNLDGDLSMCCWAKVTETVGDTANGLVSLHSHANNTGFGITVKQVSTTDYRISCSTGNGSSRTYYSYYGTTNIKNAWHHLTLTYSNTLKQFKLWVDGKVEYTLNYTNASRAETLMLFEWSTTYNAVDYRPACLLNDVRIYDHCLSAAEVHEIAMGLVLHYKLDSLNNNNLFKYNGLNNYNEELQLNNYNNTGSFTQFSNCLTIDPANYLNQKFTISFDAISPNGTTSLQLYNTNGNPRYFYYSTTLTSNLSTEWQHFSYTFTNTDRGSNYSAGSHPLEIYMPNKMGGKVRNIKVEFGEVATPWVSSNLILDNIIKDSSGYGHNGEIINSLTTLADTPRYSQCTHISATNQKIKISGLTTSGFGNSYSFVWWAKISSLNPMHWGFADGIRLNGMYTGRLWNTGDGSNNPLYQPGTTTQVSAPSTGVWHHYAMIGDGSTCKVYLDGIFWAQAKTYKAISGTTIYINGWNNSTDYSSNDLSISDFRIYCTPLLDTDIKLLYNVGMRVDNLGGVHTFELNEYSNNKIASVQVVNSSATSFTFDKTTNTYIITSPVGTSSWGYGLRFADTPTNLIVPYGYSYRWSCDIFTPIATTFVSDYNNTPISGSAWSGNDNDLTSQRLPYSISIPANTWTTVTLGSSNTHASNTSHISIRDYSSMGMITNGMSEPLVWKIKNLKWYLVEKESINSVNKKWQVFSNFYNEDSVKKIASISNRSQSFSATEFIEI